LAREILNGDFMAKDVIKVDAKAGKIVFSKA
jgi:hypothetical protein